MVVGCASDVVGEVKVDGVKRDVVEVFSVGEGDVREVKCVEGVFF